MLDSTQVEIIRPSEAKPRRPAWKRLYKNPYYSIHDAIALSMNRAPSSLDEYIETNEKAKKAYQYRLTVAQSEAHPKGQIEVVQQGTKEDKSDWTISMASFVKLAVRREWSPLHDSFKNFPTQSAPQIDVLETDTKKTKASSGFLTAFVRLLTEIAYRAGKNELDFNVSQMPGIKVDLLALMNNGKYYRQPLAESTFHDYIEALCKFKGRRSDLDFYRNLFPEHFSSNK